MVDNVNPADQLHDQDAQKSRAAAQKASGTSSTPPGGPVVPRVPPPPGSSRIPAPDTSARPAADATPRRTVSIGKVLGRIFRMVLVILTGLAIGVLLWLIVPPLFERVIAPIAENNSAVARLEAEVAAFTTEQRAALTDQREAIVRAEEANTQRFAAAEGRLADAEARLRAAEDLISAQGERISELEAQLAEATALLEAANAQIETLQAELPGAEEFAEFNYQLMLIRAWQDVLKARLRLFENNAGLAEEDLLRALNTLQGVYAGATQAQRQALDPVLDRMEAALVAVQETPFTASADLEVAWYALGELIQPVTVVSVPTPPPDVEPNGAGETPAEEVPSEGEPETPPES